MKPHEEKAAKIFLTYRDFVKEQTLRYAPIPGSSEDLFQEIFIEFVSKAEQWNLDEDVRPLLVFLAKRFAHRVIDEKKRNSPELMAKVIHQLCLAAEERQKEEKTEEHGSYAEEKKALKACMDLLPKRSRALIDLYYFQGISTENIADRMLLSVNAVYLAMNRIRNRLKKCIRKTISWENHSNKNGNDFFPPRD